MNKSTKLGPGTAPSVIAEPLPKKGGGGVDGKPLPPKKLGGEKPLRRDLTRKRAWNRPTVRIISMERTDSAPSCGTNYNEADGMGLYSTCS